MQKKSMREWQENKNVDALFKFPFISPLEIENGRPLGRQRRFAAIPSPREKVFIIP
jgi:hypothetical protein